MGGIERNPVALYEISALPYWWKSLGMAARNREILHGGNPKIRTGDEPQGTEKNSPLSRSTNCRDPLIVWETHYEHDVLLDGHNRYEICMRLGLPFKVEPMEFDRIEF